VALAAALIGSGCTEGTNESVTTTLDADTQSAVTPTAVPTTPPLSVPAVEPEPTVEAEPAADPEPAAPGASTDTTPAEPVESESAPTDAPAGPTTGPDASTPEPTVTPAPTSTPAPPAATPTVDAVGGLIPLGDFEVVNLQNGATQSIAALAPSGTTLLWFWAPH